MMQPGERLLYLSGAKTEGTACRGGTIKSGGRSGGREKGQKPKTDDRNLSAGAGGWGGGGRGVRWGGGGAGGLAVEP